VREATEQQRTSYLSGDCEGGALRGAKLVRRFPEAPELKAWYLSCLFGYDRDQALQMARQMTSNRPNEPWGWFALAMTVLSSDEALKASEKALALNPRHPDFLYLRAHRLRICDDPKCVENAIAFVDQHRSEVANPVELLVIKAQALEFLGTQLRPNPQTVKAAFEVLDEARRLDPDNYHATATSGRLLSSGDPEEGLPLLRQAVRLQPGSFGAHRELWRAYNAMAPPLQQKLRKEIEADIEDTAARHAGEPVAMTRIAEQYGTLGMGDKQKHIEDSILEKNPGTLAARNVLWNRLTRIQQLFYNQNLSNLSGEMPPPRHTSFDLTGKELPIDRAGIRERNADIQRFISSYLDHPTTEDKNLLGQMYQVLFESLERDPGCDPDELLRAVRGMKDHPAMSSNVHYQSQGAVALADRGIALAEAVEMARDSIARSEKNPAFPYREVDPSVDPNSVEARHDRAEAMARLHDALGWVLYKSGHTSEARKELEQAYALDPGEVDNLYHLGQLARGAADLKRAEKLFIECAVLPYLEGNPCPAALETLYREQHGSAVGYEQYYEGIREKGRSLKKERLLASRLPDPRPIPPFQLKSLDGEVTSSESLKGKVAVVHFWGFW
jgi:tetratricopeptide (TPR) repeat protein